jgi:protein-S-isoprenylcysteine O-methyltransferase Ste14
MRGLTSALYSVFAYVVFLMTFLYAIGFVQNAIVPKTIDGGTSGPLLPSLLIDLALLGVFAVQHSVMARPAFKKVWTRVVPAASERSTYVLFASLALLLLYWQWRPLAQTVWSVENSGLSLGILGVAWLGWGMVLLSTFLISHFHLFGLSQGFARILGRMGNGDGPFTTPFLYRWLRHPLYAGFIIAFWATPRMSLGHLVFAIATTGYILIAIQFEERDLVAQFGERYREYRRTTGMLIPKRPGPVRDKRPA